MFEQLVEYDDVEGAIGEREFVHLDVALKYLYPKRGAGILKSLRCKVRTGNVTTVGRKCRQEERWSRSNVQQPSPSAGVKECNKVEVDRQALAVIPHVPCVPLVEAWFADGQAINRISDGMLAVLASSPDAGGQRVKSEWRLWRGVHGAIEASRAASEITRLSRELPPATILDRG